MNVKDPGSRLFRWRIHLEEYDYERVYRKGSLNTITDALSWINTIHGQRETKTVVSDEETEKRIPYEYHDAHIGRHQRINKIDTAIARRIQREMVLTPTKNSTKPNPLKSIPVQSTRKKENWKTKEEMEGTAVTLETERANGPNP